MREAMAHCGGGGPNELDDVGVHRDGIDVGGADRRPDWRGERWSCVKRWCAAVGGGPTGYGRRSMAGTGARRSAMRRVPTALRARIGERGGGVCAVPLSLLVRTPVAPSSLAVRSRESPASRRTS